MYSISISSLISIPFSSCRGISGLISLDDLWLSFNNITDLSPLVANAGLGDRDHVNVGDNPIDCLDQLANILALDNRGVDLRTDCP